MNLIKRILLNKPITAIIITGIFLNVFIEALSRGSFMGLAEYIVTSPVTFALNSVIIMVTLSICMFFKRRIFVVALVTAIWIGLGIGNLFIMEAGNTPLTKFHLSSLSSAIRLSSLYMSAIEAILIIGAILAALTCIFLLWKKMPKAIINLPKAVLSLVSLVLIFSTLTFATNAEAFDLSDPREAYKNYGFAYCFSYSVLSSGIKVPNDYSEETISEITDKISEYGNDDSEIKPNIIFIQLESFFDVKTLKNVNFSEDPTPCFTELKENYPSGYMSVYSIGGGTANTEFAVLSGISLNCFSVGESPYSSVLSDSCCESVMRNLSEYGYTSTAIHPFTSTFYKRHEVFKNLGFDRFVSEEYMNITERNDLGWAKDKELIPYIDQAMAQTEGPDFLYVITVQSHGKYPSELSDENYITSDIGDNKKRNTLEFYVEQLMEVDDFIYDLTTKYENSEEPTVIVFFGDHLPALDITDAVVECGDIYKTEYVIWSNFPIEAEDKDIEANTIASHVTSLLGLANGTYNKFNVLYGDSENYTEEASLLAYDILYGNNYAQAKTYQPVNMQMGLGDIHITGVSLNNDYLYVTGENFNAFSKITVDGSVKDNTQFIDSSTLRMPNPTILNPVAVTVSQVSEDGVPLSSTEAIICEAESKIKAFLTSDFITNFRRE